MLLDKAVKENIKRNIGHEYEKKVIKVIEELLFNIDFKKLNVFKKGKLWGTKSWKGQLGKYNYLITISEDSLGLVCPQELIFRFKLYLKKNTLWCHGYKMKQDGYLKNNSPIVLGITKEGHDSSAAIVNIESGEVLSFCQEERISRQKHERRFPAKSIKEVLSQAKCDAKQIGAIAVGHSLGWYNSLNDEKPLYITEFESLPPFFAKTDFADRNRITSFSNKISSVFGIDQKHLPPTYYVRHHLAHTFAALSIVPKQNKGCVVVTADGRGEWETCTAWYTDGEILKRLLRKVMPDSLAYFYTTLGWIFGWRWYGFEGRLMGLAPYGKPQNPKEESVYNKMYELISQIINYSDNDIFTINTGIIEGGYSPERLRNYKNNGWWVNAFRLTPSFKNELLSLVTPFKKDEKLVPWKPGYRNICILAYVIQTVFRRHWENLCLAALDRTASVEKMVLCGGVALNSSANGSIATNLLKRKVDLYVPPYPADDGLPIGAAHALGWALNKTFNNAMMTCSAMLGKQETNKAVQTDLKSYGLIKERHYLQLNSIDEKVKFIEQAISSGEAVAIFYGREEAGPRALGGRSVLFPSHIGNPMADANMAKLREDWRPVAISILAENVDKFFKNRTISTYMNICAKAKNESRSEIQNILHPGDNSSRLQVVDEKSSPLLFALLKHLSKKNIFSVVNTSFNINEPIVHSCSEALDTFHYLDGVKYLLLEDYLIINKSYDPSIYSLNMEHKMRRPFNSLIENLELSPLLSVLKNCNIKDHQAQLELRGNKKCKIPLFKELYNKSICNIFFDLLYKAGYYISSAVYHDHNELKDIVNEQLSCRSSWPNL